MAAAVLESKVCGVGRPLTSHCNSVYFTTMRSKSTPTWVFVALCALLLGSSSGDSVYEMEEFLKREYSLTKPYQGLGFSSSSHWDLMGSAVVTTDHVRLTPDLQSRQGGVWSRIPCYLRDWELQRVYPFVSAMLGNGTLDYDHSRDGRPTEMGGCTAMVRNVNHDTFLLIRYIRNRLTIMMDVDGHREWRECADINGVWLPLGYYFGASSATGDLSDNHDLISMKLYELTLDETKEEGELREDEEEVTVPRVDDMPQLTVEVQEEGMSGLQYTVTVLFSLLGVAVLGGVGLVAYGRWKEKSRKRFF
ncbi:hypothetical protein CRUP_013558 [Coryphaenoides rupestris]|nr:hypothetical protein CRUP_013558 [Coryphaenoides rupestris]